MIRCPATLLLLLTFSGCGSGAGLVGDIPTQPDALFGWLSEDRYVDWASEDGIHPTAGPHGTSVLTFFNDELAVSLEGDSGASHPYGSAAVKELYDEGGELVGWAAMVKSEDSTGAESWYWYEVLDRTEPDNRFEGQGLALCADCHSQGRDFVRADWP